MSPIVKKISAYVIVATFMVLPVVVSAQGFVVCQGTECNLKSLIDLGNKVIDFFILISVPLAAIMFAYAGFLMMTAAGNESQIEKAKGIFWKVGTGFFFVLSAGLIVKLIATALLKQDYIFV
jgi:hypothetical protein